MIYKAIIAKPISLALLLFLLSLITRTIWLDKIPAGIVNDNMIFVLNAKAVYYTGKDVSGLWNPLSFAPIPDEPAQAELPYTLMAPIVGPLQSSLFSAHIFHAVVNSLFVVLLFFLVLRLLGKGPAFMVGLVATFNPWSIFFARSAFEASLALFFYVLGFYILLTTTSWKKLWSVIPLAFGFFSYMAYKLTFLPYVFIISYFTWSHIHSKKYTKQYLVLFFMCVFIFLFFLVRAGNQSTSQRFSEVSFFSTTAIEAQVNYERRIAVLNPLTNMFSNKMTVAVKTVVSKYFESFSTRYLFISNEGTQRFNMYNHGYFYYLDLIFFIVGFLHLFIYQRKIWMLLFAMILISPIPSVASNVGVSFAMRSSLYFPFLYIFIGTGIWQALMYIKNKKLFAVSMLVILGLYLISISNFLYTYFFIQPIYGAEGAAFSHRLISRYAALANQQNKKITIVSDSPKGLFKDFIFYSDSYNKQTAAHFRNAFLYHNYSFENVSFVRCEKIKKLSRQITYIFTPGEKCKLFNSVKNPLYIVQLSDSGSLYSIFQDSLCSGYNLKRYISKLSLRDFEVENLSAKQFCETYIIDYSDQ